MSFVLIKHFLKNPATTGTVWPSSTALCRELVNGINIEQAKTVVELGPGTGVVTRQIIKHMHNNAHFFTIELNESICKSFSKKLPDVKIYNDSAANLKQLLEHEGLQQADCVISGLPWASLPLQVQNEILDAIVECLPQGGYFTTFAYLQGTLLPVARKFKKQLDNHFSEVKKSRVIWKNMPPAFVYHCRK
jgi:phosphatidylethanolamine/phosphatidyl-N-methylethanolamine N-methyltransferase